MKSQATRNDVLARQELKRQARVNGVVSVVLALSTAFLCAYALAGLMTP